MNGWSGRSPTGLFVRENGLKVMLTQIHKPLFSNMGVGQKWVPKKAQNGTLDVGTKD